MRERLRPADHRFIAICLLLLAGTTWFSIRNFHHAFPEASIDFRVNRDGARTLAQDFLAARGYRLDGYRQAGRFNFDNSAKTFLEREAGLDRANQLMGSRIRIWRWSNRWFRPQQKEEFSAEVTPRGEVVEFEHEIAEDAARPSLTPAEARAAAENFLATVMHREPASLEFVEGSSIARPHRTDHDFTWKERDFNLKDATYRIEVTVLGSEVGVYREYLKVPEQWQRDYARLRSRNQAAQTVDTAFMMLLIVGLVVVLVLSIRGHQVRWRDATVVGMVGGALFFLSSWNEFPLTEFGYPTTDSYASFVARQVLNSLLGALASGGLLFLLTAAAEPLYRQYFGGRIALGNLFRLSVLRTRSFFLGTVLGLSLTGMFIAYQIAFYMTAARFGAWSPADVPYSDLLNTRLPWAFVLFGGFLPAVSEEFIFRMFAIPFLRKVLRSMWVAVIVAGFVWGFGHAGYPQQPFFIRGLEVGIGGVALGLIMLRWGILPTLVWHYSVDAMYSALLLMRSDSTYFKLSGAASAGIMLLPALISLAIYFRNGGFEPETQLTNAAMNEAGVENDIEVETPAAAEEPPAAPAAAHVQWTTRRRLAALALFAAGLVLAGIPLARIGSAPRFKLSAAQALASGDRFLRAQQSDPSAFRHVVSPGSRWYGDDEQAGKYFLERRPPSWVATQFERNRPLLNWSIRYFKVLDKEEWLMAIHPETGAVMGFRHAIAEDQAGAGLSNEAANAIATATARSLGWDVSAMDLKESTSEKKKARRDHSLVWEARKGDARNLDQAFYRVQVDIAGDRPSAARVYWKLPEAWQRARSEQNAVSITTTVLQIALISILVVSGLLFMIHSIRNGSVPWVLTLRTAIPFTLLGALDAVLMMHLMWRGYSTAIPETTFRIVSYTSIGVSIIVIFLTMAGLAALLHSLRPEAWRALTAPWRRTRAIDALLAALAGAGLALIASNLRALIADRLHAQAFFDVRSPDVIASLAPAVSVLAGSAQATLLSLAVLALAAYLWGYAGKASMRAAAVVLLVALMAPSEARTPGEFALGCTLGSLPLAALVIFCRNFARDNWLAYALAAWLYAIAPRIMQLLGQPNPTLQLQGWLVVTVAAAVVLWIMLPALQKGANDGD